MSHDNMHRFGTKVEGEDYTVRAGAYGITRDSEGRVAFLEIGGRLFLPGGGIDLGEEAEAALCRECKEEAGWDIEVLGSVGQAHEYLFGPTEQKYFDIQGDFYLFRIVSEAKDELIEPGLQLVWLAPEDAVPRMARESQAAMVRLAVEKTP